MSCNKIKAILIQEVYITLRSTEVIFDITVFPLASVILFAFLSRYLSSTNPEIAQSVLLGMLLWQLVYIAQYTVCLGSLWNIWSRNLSNMFIAPLSIAEYLTSYSLSAIIKACFILIICFVGLYAFFDFSILKVGFLNLFLYFISLMLFAFTLGYSILGLIFRYGSRINALAWGLLPLIQPLTGSLFPIRVLPGPLQTIAYMLPPTYVFEAARFSLNRGSIEWAILAIGMFENVVYLLLSLWFFRRMFEKSQETGQFARNET